MMHYNSLFGCFQVPMFRLMERQTERQVQKQSVSNMHCTANIHTTAHSVKIPVSQKFFKLLGMPRIRWISNSIYIGKWNIILIW